jgi:hypothetical protein
MEDIRNRFAEERKRYLELTGKKPADGPAVVPATDQKPADAAGCRTCGSSGAGNAAPAKPADKKK